MTVLSPGAFGLAPDARSHTERVWFPAGTVLLEVARGGSSSTSVFMLDGRLFEISSDLFVPVSPAEDCLDGIA